MDYIRNIKTFMEIVQRYQFLGYKVIISKCRDCGGSGTFTYFVKGRFSRGNKVKVKDCTHCHGTGRIVYPTTLPEGKRFSFGGSGNASKGV